MADLRKMWTRVTLATNVRTVHKLYEALYGVRNHVIIAVEDDANLIEFSKMLEGILEQSGYMTPAEIRFIREPIRRGN